MNARHAAQIGLCNPPSFIPFSNDDLKKNSLNAYQAISLQEMDDVVLMDRVDTKYVFSEELLSKVLETLKKHYVVLEIDGRHVSKYKTLYYDSPDFQLFQKHHSGANYCYKVRSRLYVETDLSFLEVKQKTKRKRTIKTRFSTSFFSTQLNDLERSFIREQIPQRPENLEPKVWNDFSRITLVSKGRNERLTIDTDIRFRNHQESVGLGGLIVAEVKQSSHSRKSQFMLLMRQMGIRPTGFSKYCLGVSLLYPQVKHNNFKPKKLLAEKIMKGKPLNERLFNIYY